MTALAHAVLGHGPAFVWGHGLTSSRASEDRLPLLRWDAITGAGRQVVRYDATQAHTSNHDAAELAEVVDALLAEPFGNWHVATTEQTLQVRVTKKGDAMVHRSAATAATTAPAAHDRVKERLIPTDEPFLRELGVTDADGRVKPTRERKYRQGSRHKLKVLRVDDKGAQLEVEQGLSCYCSWRDLLDKDGNPVERATDAVKQGQEIEVEVRSFDRRFNKVSVSMRALVENETRAAYNEYKKKEQAATGGLNSLADKLKGVKLGD